VQSMAMARQPMRPSSTPDERPRATPSRWSREMPTHRWLPAGRTSWSTGDRPGRPIIFASHRLRRAAISASTAITVLSAAALSAAAPASAAPTVPAGCSLAARVVTCAYAPVAAEQEFVVPAGVTTVDVDAVGGHGGDLPPNYRGGAAGHVSVTAFSVTPGATFYVEVGGNGSGAGCGTHQAAGGWNGGGWSGYAPLAGGCTASGAAQFPGFSGGGATDLRTATLGSGTPLTGVRATDPRLLVAGGGGGSADWTVPGGSGGVPSSDAFNGNGADGQFENSFCNGTTADDCHFGGYGGKQDAGGAGGAFGGGAGGPGSGGSGATGPSVNSWWLSGGGGGAGWFGGGGGGSEGQAAGIGAGGGGSSMVPAGGTVLAPTHDAPRALISYTLPPDLTAPTQSITAPVDGAALDLGQVVAAAYSCADDDSGVATCAGPVASGADVDTTTPGEHTFTVTATDVAGNVATKMVHYMVVDHTPPPVTLVTPVTPGGGTTTPTVTTPPPPPLTKPTITRGAATKATVSSTGAVTLPGTTVTCPRGAGVCRVITSLRVTIKVPGHKTRTQTLSSTIAISPGATSKLKRTMPASLLRSLLTRGAKLTVTATLKARNTVGTTMATKAFRIVAAT
jgi:hypothetical protein